MTARSRSAAELVRVRWLDELSELRRRRPRLASVVDDVRTHQRGVAVCLVAGWTALATATSTSSDFGLFLAAARHLGSPAGLDAFSDPAVQVGSTYLVLVALASADGALPAFLAALFFGAFAGAAVAAGLAWLIRREGGSPAEQAGAAVSAVVAGPVVLSALDGQHADVLVALLVLMAASGAAGATRRVGWLANGALVGLSASVKLWGLFGLAGLLLISGIRGRLIAAGTAVAFVTASYVPFLLGGRVATQDFSWSVTEQAPLSVVVTPGAVYGAEFRAGQLVVVLSVGAALALRRYRPWAVVLIMLMTRFVTDPVFHPYYAGAGGLCVVFAAWSSDARGRRWTLLTAVAAATYLPYATADHWTALSELAVALLAAGYALLTGNEKRRQIRGQPPPPA